MNEHLLELLNEPWSNNACLGYVLLAAQNLNMEDAEIHELIHAVCSLFDAVSAEQAKAVYEKSSF